jgi:hypothetical protein
LEDKQDNDDNHSKSGQLGSNASENHGKTNDTTIDIRKIFNDIAPYLSEPEIIMSFLESHSHVSIDELKVLIEPELKSENPIRRTDFRILLNSI